MARKKVKLESKFKTWEEINDALRQIAEKRSRVNEKINAYNAREAERRKALDEFTGPVLKEVEELEQHIYLFCDEHRADFGKKKSKDLPNGYVAFRLGTPKIKTLSGWTLKASLAVIEKTKELAGWVRVKREMDKEQILNDYAAEVTDAEKLKEVGLKVVQDESFAYEARTASDESGKGAL